MICPNIGFVYAGMGPDYRVLVAKARKIAQSYWKVYGEYPPVKVLVADVAAVMQKATQSGYVLGSFQLVICGILIGLLLSTEVYDHTGSPCLSLDGTTIEDSLCTRSTLRVVSGRGKRARSART